MRWCSSILLGALAAGCATASADMGTLDSLDSRAAQQPQPGPGPQPLTQPSSSLPAAPAGTSLLYVLLGLGTQNYSCASTPGSAGSAPVALGALAQLYDAYAVLDSSAGPSDQRSVQYLPCAADRANSSFGLKQLGVHYFAPGAVPTFDLSQGTASAQYPHGRFLSAAKIAAQPAPASACAGRDRAPAVPWLYLADNASGLSRGLAAVYRLETAGGSAPSSCAGQSAAFTVDYSAEYWFYG